MKLPVSAPGQVQASREKGQYIDAPNSDFGMAIGKGLGTLAAGVGAFAEKQAQIARFGALEQLSNWSEETERYLTDEAQNSPENDANYFERVNGVIENKQRELYNRIPASLQDEFSPRIAEVANSLRGSAFKYDEEKKTEYYRGGIARELERQKLVVGRDASALADRRKFMYEHIDSSGLSAAEKTLRKRAIDMDLEKVGYRQRLREEHYANAAAPGSVESFTNKLFGAESANDPNAKNKRSTATGLAQVIESTWDDFITDQYPEDFSPTGEHYKLRTDEKKSREFVAWYADKNATKFNTAGVPVNEGTLYLGHFAGGQGAVDVYTSPPGTPLEKVLSAKAMRDNPNLAGKTTGWLVDWAYQQMGRKDAYSRVDDDPEYANLTYEDRLDAREAVNREIAGEAQAQAQRQKAAMDEARNALFLDLIDKKAGQSEINDARRRGILSDVDDVEKAQGYLKRANKEADDLTRFTSLISTSHIWTDSDSDRDAVDAGIKASGIIQGIENKDPNVMVPLHAIVSKTNRVPREATQVLGAMAQSRDWESAKYALDILSMMKGTAFRAWNSGADPSTRDAVAIYDARKDLYSAEELQSVVQGGTTPEERDRNVKGREEAEGLLKKYSTDEIFDKFTSVLTFGEKPPATPFGDHIIFTEYSTLFTDYYAKTRDAELSDELAMKRLHEDWGFFEMGGSYSLMKYPPDKSYQPFNGSFDYMEPQARELLELADEPFALVGDSQTIRERLNGKPPSYAVVVTHKDGVPRPAAKRVRFEITDEMRAKNLDNIALGTAEADLFEAKDELFRAQQRAYSTPATGAPVEIPQELFDRVKALEARTAQMRGAVNAPIPGTRPARILAAEQELDAAKTRLAQSAAFSEEGAPEELRAAVTAAEEKLRAARASTWKRDEMNAAR